MSLHLRLALWYGGLTGLVVLLVAGLAYAVHTRGNYEELDRSLRSAAAHVAAEYDGIESADGLVSLLTPATEPDIAIGVYDDRGEALLAAPGARLVPSLDLPGILANPVRTPYDPLVILVPPLSSDEAGPGVFSVLAGSGGDRWRVFVAPSDVQGTYVVAEASLERIDSSVERLRWLLLLTAALGATLTLAGGLLLAGRALQPVATLTETARAIARSRGFSRRVPVGDRRDELGRLAVTFNEMLDSLEQAYRHQQRFVSDASHELRAPLTAIQANLELLQHQQQMPPAEQREAVAEAGREAARLARLVADLLALARADAGVPLRRQPVELDRVLMEALGEARHLGRGQSVEITDLEPVGLQGDPDRLRQLVLILVDNALKYTPAGGRVAVALRRNGRTAEMNVQDTGVGIPPEDLPHVFQRFYRADPARGRDPGGTGLGLPIAKWIAEQHGGSITLESAPGHGTLATVHLPLGG